MFSREIMIYNLFSTTMVIGSIILISVINQTNTRYILLAIDNPQKQTDVPKTLHGNCPTRGMGKVNFILTTLSTLYLSKQ